MSSLVARATMESGVRCKKSAAFSQGYSEPRGQKTQVKDATAKALAIRFGTWARALVLS
jgi:hypothetical protein